MSEQLFENQLDSGIRRGVERRLEFIEYRLFWEGGVNRSDITIKFGVSVPQASNDLTQYRDLAPLNIRYDGREKRYLRTTEFRPVFRQPNASHYLVELKAFADQVLTPAESWIGLPPEVGVMPVPGRRVDPVMLRSLVEAIRAGKSINAHYHSMKSSRPDAIWQWLTPHAFSSDGLRWHVRAYCHIEERFKDFLLSRFLNIGELGPPGATPASDRDWSCFFDVVLVPNPALQESKRRTITLEYEMTDGRLTLPVRCALLYYFNKRLRLDVSCEADEPHEAPIIVANKTEFTGAIEAATGSVLRS